jgi:4-hydroxy-2-oxoheptanedioate aldolase
LKYGARYLSLASDTIVSFAMIETRDGLANLDEILLVPGFDGVFIGPSDLALALGRAPQADPDDPYMLDVIRVIRKRAHAAGKRVGIYCLGARHARAMLEEGFDLVSVATDLHVMAAAVGAALHQSRTGLSAVASPAALAAPTLKAQ